MLQIAVFFALAFHMPGIVLLTERRVRNKFIGTLYYVMNY